MPGYDRLLRLSALLLYFAVPFCFGEVRAADFIVPSATTVGQQTLTDVGDTGVIESGGAITSAASAVLMLNADQTVINDGAISTTGFFGAGIQSAHFVASRNVKVAITGNCGPNAVRTLSAAGVAIVVGQTGNVIRWNIDTESVEISA